MIDVPDGYKRVLGYERYADPIAFELSDGEKTHPLWMRLKAHLESQLESKRRRNDGALSEMETATLRGHIQALKAMIALGDDRPLTGEE